MALVSVVEQCLLVGGVAGRTMREYLEHRRDLARYLLAPRKTLVLVLCAMRSGSTLLKAVLGMAPDVSHLPEIRFHHLRTNAFDFYARFCHLAAEPIIVLKHPVWFTDAIGSFEVPRLRRIRLVCLMRDCYPTLCSIKTMPGNDKPDDSGLIDYWVRCTSQVLTKHGEAGGRGRCIRYEDLIADPVAVSARLFRFIGSSKSEGVQEYVPPAAGEWQWGSDDGSEKIRTRKVQAAVFPHDPELLARVESDSRVMALRAQLGYAEVRRNEVREQCAKI